jgi:hypothetical protein
MQRTRLARMEPRTRRTRVTALAWASALCVISTASCGKSGTVRRSAKDVTDDGETETSEVFVADRTPGSCKISPHYGLTNCCLGGGGAYAGCEIDVIQRCVCQQMPECCSKRWSYGCAREADSNRCSLDGWTSACGHSLDYCDFGGINRCDCAIGCPDGAPCDAYQTLPFK